MSYDLLQSSLDWVLWLGIGLQFALAVRALLVERREGMPTSRARAALTGGAFAISTLLLLAATHEPQETRAPIAVQQAPAQSANPEVQRLESELAKLKADLNNLTAQQKQIEQKQRGIRRQIDVLRPSVLPRVVLNLRETDGRTRQLLAFTAMAVLLIIGVIVLTVGGRLQTLFPDGSSWFGGRRSEADEALRRKVDEIAGLVSAEKYTEAVAKAATVPEKKLAAFDQLDFLFLRGFSVLQLAAFPKPEDTEEQRRRLFETAIQDLEAVVAEAPKRADALYTLAIAYALTRKSTEALQAFEHSEEKLKSEKHLPFAHNKSVCLLQLAEASLSAGKPDEAAGYFDRVAKLGHLAGSVVQSRIRIGMIDLRAAMSRQDMTGASETLEKIAGLENLDQSLKLQVDVICSALNARIALRRDEVQSALDQTTSFLNRYLPSGLPQPDEESVDEPFSPVLDDDLRFPREVFLGFLFIQAVALSRMEGKNRSAPPETRVARLAEPLMRALQFVPRQRDLLGAVGGLYYWFRRDKRDKAREWLEAAVSMGARGRVPRAILERDRLVEMERSEALDWFRSASARFLRDPALATEVRHALVEELGRFQEFEPMLISLREKPEIESEEPTVQGLRERAAYLSDLLARMARRGEPGKFARLAQIQGEYTVCLSSLELATQTISTLERRVFAELAENLSLE